MGERPVLRYYKENDDVPDLKYGAEDAACFDICSYLPQGRVVKMWNRHNEMIEAVVDEFEGVVIPPHCRALIPTGLYFEIDPNYSVRVHMRSGASIRKGLMLTNGTGVIDWSYANEACQPVVNTSETGVVIGNGEALCQAELVPHRQIGFERIFTPPKPRTNRKGGFGSTVTGQTSLADLAPQQ